MYKGIINTSTSVSASGKIPFTKVLNTNSNTSYSTTNNTVSILSSGYYDIDANITVTGVAVGNITFQLYIDGVAYPEASATATSSATTDYLTVPISDILKVYPSSASSNVEMYIAPSVACTVANAIFTVEKRK